MGSVCSSEEETDASPALFLPAPVIQIFLHRLAGERCAGEMYSVSLSAAP